MKKRNATGIHLIEKLGLIRQIEGPSGEYESGFWKVGHRTAEGLVGGDIYFHRKRAEPSFFGGRILSFRIQPDGKYADRIIFRFRAMPSRQGVATGSDGWGMEKKFDH